MDFTRLLINLSDLQQYSTELTEKSVDCGALLGKTVFNRKR